MPLAPQNLTIAPNSLNVLDGATPDGHDAAHGTLTLATVPPFTQQQGGFSIPLASYVTYTGGGTLAYSIASGALVGDWAINSSTGVFSGTSLGGPTTFRVHVTDGTLKADTNGFLVESIAASSNPDVTAPTDARGLTTLAIANTQIDVQVDCSADVPNPPQDCKGMKEMRFMKNGAVDGVAAMTPGLAIKYVMAETPPFNTQRRFPSGHVVSVPMFEAIGGGNIVPVAGQGAYGDDATYPKGSIPGGHLGTTGGLTRTGTGPASPGVVMITQVYSWRELEPTQATSQVPGQPGFTYDFTRIADDLKQCHALGVYLCVEIIVRTFNNDAGTGALNPAPDYLGGQTTPSVAHPYCTYYTPSHGGYQMWRWDTFVLQRYRALATALAAQFDNNTAENVHYAGICTQETATNMANAEQVAAGYTCTKYLAGLKAEVDAIMNTHHYGIQYGMYNFAPANPSGSTDTMTPKVLLDQYVAYLVFAGSVMGGPDILPSDASLVAVYARYQQAGAKSRRFCSMQNTSFQLSASLTSTYQWGRDALGLEQVWWFWKRGGAANWYEHGTDKAIDVIAADLNATPSRIPFGAFNPGSCVQSGVDYTIASYGEGFSLYDGTADQYSSGRGQSSGDFFISAELNSVTGPSLVNSIAGLCMRDDTSGGSRAVWIYVTAAGLVVRSRSATAGFLTQVVSIPGVNWSTPTHLKIQRTGNVFTCFYSKDKLAWTAAGAGATVVMTDPVIAEPFVASGNYSKVTAVFKSVCLQNIAPKTHSYTGLSPGTFYDLSAVGRDLATTPNDSNPSPTLRVKTTGAAITRKWDPGNWVLANSKATGTDDASTSFNNDLTKISGMAGIKGICYPYAWQVLETALNTYDYTLIDRDINRVSGASKKMGIQILDRAYNGTTPVGGNILPAYLLSDTTAYGSGADGVNSGYWTKSTAGFVAASWRANVMDRLIALMQDMATHLDPANGLTLDASANVAWVEFAITDLNVSAGSDFTAAALVTQLKRFRDAAIAAWPHTPIRLVCGTLAGMSDLVNTTATAKGAVGGLDVKGILTPIAKRYFPGQQAWCGTYDGTSVDQRGLMPIIQMVGQGELDGSQYAADGSPYSLADLQSSLAFLGTNYAVWKIINAAGSGNWTTAMQPFLATGPARVTTRPTGW